MIYWQLFISFFKVGLFAIGGAYSFLPLVERECVINHAWMTKSEFLEISGIVKIFPGAISVKYATYIGQKVAGIMGAVLANVANLLAPVALIICAEFFYKKYYHLPSVKSAFNMVQIVIFAMIIAIAFQMVDLSKLVHLKSVTVALLAFALFMFTKIEPALVIIGAGLVGAFLK